MDGWGAAGRALRLSVRRTTLRRTLRIAFVVGTIMTLVNQGGVILRNDANLATWLRVAANYAVPLFVSSLGFISAARRGP